MAHNSLYPGFVKIQYTHTGLVHTMVLPVEPQSGWVVGSEPSLEQNDGTFQPLGDAVDAFILILKAGFHSATEFLAAEAWFYDSVTSDPQWVFTHPIAVPGTHATAATPAGQAVISFRTSFGGNYRLYWMEPAGAISTGGRNSWPFGAGTQTNVANYLMGNDGWVIGRDGGKLVIPIWNTTKINDALRKKRLNI